MPSIEENVNSPWEKRQLLPKKKKRHWYTNFSNILVFDKCSFANIGTSHRFFLDKVNCSKFRRKSVTSHYTFIYVLRWADRLGAGSRPTKVRWLWHWKSTFLPVSFYGYRLVIGWRAPVKGGRVSWSSFPRELKGWGLGLVFWFSCSAVVWFGLASRRRDRRLLGIRHWCQAGAGGCW